MLMVTSRPAAQPACAHHEHAFAAQPCASQSQAVPRTLPQRVWPYSQSCTQHFPSAVRSERKPRPLLLLQESDSAGKLASFGSYLGGVLCAIGWYIFLGAVLEAANHDKVEGLSSGARTLLGSLRKARQGIAHRAAHGRAS